jgi:hypothetical protein
MMAATSAQIAPERFAGGAMLAAAPGATPPVFD